MGLRKQWLLDHLGLTLPDAHIEITHINLIYDHQKTAPCTGRVVVQDSVITIAVWASKAAYDACADHVALKTFQLDSVPDPRALVQDLILAQIDDFLDAEPV